MTTRPSQAPTSADPPPDAQGPGSGTPASKGTKRPPLYFNVVSHLGGLIVVLAAILIALSMLRELRTGAPSPYVGIFTYLVFPTLLGVGVLLFLLGMRWEAGRRRKLEALEHLPYPRIDLNDRRQRRLFAWSTVGGVVVATLVVWASYQGFHFTESTYFCGEVCHVPMKPEFVAYKDTAHARVPCVDCHVGGGAGWYVRAKLSGVRQLIAVATGTYSRPIPSPGAHLRPARETCERCHWPEKDFGATLLQVPHFRYDEPNQPEQISLTLKIGGGAKTHGQSQGVHWHMVVSNEVTYAAQDDQLQVIPWTRVKRADGTETTYTLKGTKLSQAALDALPRRTMDCMDCHNRPAHDFPNPDSAVDEALLKGRIARDLPWIKTAAVEALFRVYPDRRSAHDGIRAHILDHYAKTKPEVLQSRSADVETAIRVSQALYDRGVFPEMKVDWQTYPRNIGHRYWAGCFRCHDGKHVSPDGKVLAHDCDSTCHTRPVRGTITELGAVDPRAREDWHPWQMPKEHLDVAGHDTVLCHECHGAGRRPSRECNDCHDK